MNMPQGVGGGLQTGPGANLLGRVLDGRFVIKSILGTGGMGTVYRAEQTSMRRDVAVKVVRRDILDEGSVRRFLIEAQAASRLKSPHTVTVFEFGRTSDDILYLAMELLVGKTLAQVLKEEGKPFGVIRAVRIINQVLNSMEEAHGLGILHRDLKPENIFLLDVAGSQDFLKVLDFGVAKMVGDSEHGTTVGGVSFGTPVYMSPEHMMNRKLGPTTDLYSVAIMLFEMLAGKPPLDELSPVENAMRKASGKFPSLRQLNPETETVPELDSFLARALESDPANRPPDINAFRNEFNRVVHSMIFGGNGISSGMLTPPPFPAVSIPLPVRESPDQTLVMPQPNLASPAQPVVQTNEAANPQPPLSYRGRPISPPIRLAPVDEHEELEEQPDPVQPPPTPPRRAAPVEERPNPPTAAPRVMQVRIAPVQEVVTPAAPPTRLRPKRNSDSRLSPRVPRLRSIVCLAGVMHHKALLAEVSESGAFVNSNWLPRPGDKLSIMFPRSDGSPGPSIIIGARVVRVIDKALDAGQVRGFSVKWLVLRTQGRLAALQSFYKDLFDLDLPGDDTHEEARLWEYWFEDKMLQRNVTRCSGV